MPRIDIIRKPDGTIAFDPPELRGAAIGDRIFWRNLDPQEKHWITRKGERKDFWFRFAVERFVPGIPADTTREVVLQKEADITYVSFLHPGNEGTIVFSQFVEPMAGALDPIRGAKRASKAVRSRRR